MSSPFPSQTRSTPVRFCKLFNGHGHMPASSYIRNLIAKAVRIEPALEEYDLASALEEYPMAELRDGKGIVLCDVVDAIAFLEWLARAELGAEARGQGFHHRRRQVLRRTLIHEGVEWMARRLELFPILDSALQRFLMGEKIDKKMFAESFLSEYGMDIADGQEGVYHLFAEFCDDFRRPASEKHLPEGVLSAAAAFMFSMQDGGGVLGPLRRNVEKQVPELPEEAYVLQEAAHPAFKSIRRLLDERGLRIAPLEEVHELDKLIDRLSLNQKDPEERKTILDELERSVPGMKELSSLIFSAYVIPRSWSSMPGVLLRSAHGFWLTFRPAIHFAGSRSSATTRT